MISLISFVSFFIMNSFISNTKKAVFTLPPSIIFFSNIKACLNFLQNDGQNQTGSEEITIQYVFLSSVSSERIFRPIKGKKYLI